MVFILHLAPTFGFSAYAIDKSSDNVASYADLSRFEEPLELAARFMSGGCGEVPDGFEGIYEIRCYSNDDEIKPWEKVREEVGYIIYDFNGDGINELAIGTNVVPYPNSPRKTMILALYAMSNGKPKLLLSGTSRRSWYYQDNGWFYMTGAESAARVISGQYSYINGILNCEHFWFSSLNAGGDHEYYHSYSDTLDQNAAVKLNYTMDDYNLNDENNIDQSICLELIPFSDLRPIIAEHDDGGKIRFTALQTLKDFKIIDLCDVVYSDGKINVTEKERLSMVLESGQSISIYMPFLGDGPEYAISFTDSLGKIIKMTVSLSGMDGSIILNQYNW